MKESHRMKKEKIPNTLLYIYGLLQKECSCKTWSKIVIAAVAAVIGGAALIAFVVDPLYRYRMPFFYKTVYHEIYATAPALLKHEKFDLFMIGTSMTRNFFIEDIDKTLNCRSLKFAASGGTMIDLKKMVDTAIEIKGKNLKRIVFSLDIYPLNKTKPHYKQFDYMYTESHAQDYRYLFSRQTFSTILYLIKRQLRPSGKRKYQADRNRMFSTEYDGKPYGLQAVMSDARSNARSHHTQTPYNKEAHQKNLRDELLPMFDNNPDVDFTVYLAPYHIYTYCQSEQFNEADALIKQRTQVMLELLKRSNVKLHDFQADDSIVLCHDYFSDVQHFSREAAQIVLKKLVSGSNRITTPEEVHANEKKLRELIKTNMPVYYKHLKEIK